MRFSSGLLVAASAATAAAQSGPAPTIELVGQHGTPISTYEVGDTLAITVDGVTPRAAYDVRLVDDLGAEQGFARATANLAGQIEPEVLWWESGVTGPDPDGRGHGGWGFADWAAAESYLAGRTLTIEVRHADPLHPGAGPMAASRVVPLVATRQTPHFWFSDAGGRYRTSFEANAEGIWVSGDHLPAGATVDLYVVADRTEWEVGDPIVDVTGFNGVVHKERLLLAPGSTSFSLAVWPAVYQRTGCFDLVARINDPKNLTTTTLLAGDVLAHGWEQGLVVEPPPPAVAPASIRDLDVDLTGRRTTSNRFPGFRRQNVFVRHNSVYVNLDPSDIPPNHPKPKTAAIYVVKPRSAAGWAAMSRLSDLTETVEIRNVKPGTVAAGIFLAWTDPNPVDETSRYDVVLDFRNSNSPYPPTGGAPGAPPPGSSTNAGYDGFYDKGLDALDALHADGLTIVHDPAEFGPYPIGRTQYDFIDAYDIPYGGFKDQNVDVRAVVAYPGASAGADVPVFGSTERFPMIFILHGNHNVCLSGGCTCSSNRIPNHKGYDYLLDLWASHGFVAVSIDGYDITGCPTDRFIERGALMLEHQRYWTEWDDPAIPDATYSGRFWNRLNLHKVGYAGHSRGGEGVAAAVQINRDLALGYDITAALLIAPTDYNWNAPPGGGPTEFVIADTPVFNIMGTSDGDVIDLDGAQLYDRAGPAGLRADKSQAVVYGADHNSWNTIWIDPAWNGGSDGVGSGRITAQQQQDTGRVFMTSWWMAWLQDRTEMLAFHRDAVQSPLLSAVETHWTYQSADSVAIDDFQQAPKDPFKNSLGGVVTVTPAPVTYQENSLRPGAYNGSFRQDTDGLIVGWNAVTTYETQIPAAWQDVSDYSFIAMRVTQIYDNKVLNPGGGQHVLVELEDANGHRQSAAVDTRAFTTIPVGYNHPFTGRKSLLKSVRIPLRSFTQENSALNLRKITKVIITGEATGLLAFDDLQFTK